MFRSHFFFVIALLSVFCTSGPPAQAADDRALQLDAQFKQTVRPFLQQYCASCHGKEKTEADLELAGMSSMADAVRESERWTLIAEKLEKGKMPPKKAKVRPADDARKLVARWFRQAIEDQTLRNAGDPGLVLARRLSNNEYDYAIRDLTGVDLRPARQFPVDPVNTAGFDNSGESLVMSPSLLNKYLQAARDVAGHLVLKPHGFTFAPYPMLAETERDRYCVQQIIAFYRAQDIDYADYFETAWRYKCRAALGNSAATLADIAKQRKVSPKYLATIWNMLEEQHEEVGPLVKLQAIWKQLPQAPGARTENVRQGCEQMRQYVVNFRKKVEPRFLNFASCGSTNSQPLLIWKNVQYATHRMTFDPRQLQVEGENRAAPTTQPEPGAGDEFGPGHTVLVVNAPGDPDLLVPAGQRERYEAAFARFCRVFPDRFYMQERGRNYFDSTKDRGRYLSAGFHSLYGFFRDDQPLYELVLDEKQQKELDGMWDEMDFIASASIRMYTEFCGSTHHSGKNPEAANQPVAVDELGVTAEARIKQREQGYLDRAKQGDPRGIDAVKYYFTWMNDRIRWTEKARIDAEPSHLQSLLEFAAKAYRRLLADAEKDDIVAYYKSCRSGGLDHDSAISEGIVGILMSPDFCYRLDLSATQKGIHPLSDYELASRLSFFLWSSLPDETLLAHAAAGDLHQPAVTSAEVQRMLKDARVRALAVEFGGSWLDFRRFDEISSVDRDRFPAFTNDLREAMYEEPIRFLTDALTSNRSMLDLLYGNYTFVNAPLAKHYGIACSTKSPDDWVRIDNADQYGRGGILGMAAFMTKNAPGLRTSPVKRGNWVVRNLLGERIPAPPPNVPQLPHDEAKLDLPLRDMLARHRQDPACAACHARFDSFGLVFEGYGPVGERRDHDLAGHVIDASATFPDGGEGVGIPGLRDYIRQHRQKDFTDSFCRKVLAYALGRSLILSDGPFIQQLEETLAKDNYRFDTLIEGIVTSPQFLNKKGREG